MKVFYASLLCIACFRVSAQHDCGQLVTPEQVAYLEAHSPAKDLAFRRSNDTLLVPLLFHRIGRNDGSGAVTEAQCDAALAALNQQYAAGNIQFFKCADTRLIADTTFFDYAYDEEWALRQAHEVSGVINVFVPNRLAGSSGGQLCGYAYLPPTRRDIAMVRKSCFTSGTTLAHEVGHYLGLYHTHGKSNCGDLTDELADGTNCDTAGDDVCDTPADPNLLGPNCNGYEVNGACEYTGTRPDAAGQPFAPDTRNIMAYSRPACRQYLTAGQFERVRYYLNTSRSYLECVDCAPQVPQLSAAAQGYSYAEIDVAAGPDDERFEVEAVSEAYGNYTFTTTSVEPLLLSGYPSCDSLTVRVRSLCQTAVGDWSTPLGIRLAGCAAAYCPQTNFNSNVHFASLAVGGTPLPNIDSRERYGVHATSPTVTLDADDATFDVAFRPSLNGSQRSLNGFVQVWADFDGDGQFATTERLLQEQLPTGQTYSRTLTVPASAPRGTPVRLRTSISIEYFIDPCDIEYGETEDVNVVFADAVVASAAWDVDTLRVGPEAGTTPAALTANVDWTVSAPAEWMSYGVSAGDPATNSVDVAVDRNTGCEARYHTVVLNADSASDLLIVEQAAAPAHIDLRSEADILVAASGSEHRVSATSLHAYAVTAPDWLAAYRAADQLDDYTVDAAVPPNLTDVERSGTVTLEGCGARREVTFTQPFVSTEWADTARLRLAEVTGTVELAILSNVAWSVAASEAWIVLGASAGSGDGSIAVSLAPDAPAGAVGYLTLQPGMGAVRAGDRVYVQVPRSSSTRELTGLDLAVANPFGERLQVRLRGSGVYSVQVRSAMGVQLSPKHVTHQLDLDTAAWPAGMYVLLVEDAEGRRLTRRLIKG